ncbi:MAG: YnbE family lipoprotein [Novosphingobium sp.]
MTYRELTDGVPAAIVPAMQGFQDRVRLSGLRGNAVAMVVGCAMALGGCVSVNAPDKPIVIELNINIKQEVIYRLAADAGATIDKNSGIF